ncbi:MAG: PorV/PorQ family protein [Candidatus Firestonebacteria bacterium]|nr:PorV/PorQ family protein [Candidatus Firestonebacteria bacterium]
MKRLVMLVLAVGCGWVAGQAWGAERGTTSADYLKIGLGAGAVGMGEAYAAHAGDVTSMFYNPAGLAEVDVNQLTATHLNWIADTQYEALAYARPNLEFGTIGLSLFMLHMPPIPARDELNNDTGLVNAYDLGVQFSYARDLNRWTGLTGLEGGVSLKFLRRELAGLSASGGAADLGAIYHVNENWSLGLALSNLGYLSPFGNESGQESLPAGMRVGVAYTLAITEGQKLLAMVDLTQAVDDDLKANAGLEYSLGGNLHARVGYKYGYANDGFQTGLGLGWQNLSVDYALKIMGTFGLTHYVSASWGFGEPIGEQQQDRGQTLLKSAEDLYSQSKYPEALKVVEEAIVINPKSQQAQQLRDKLKTVLDMLQMPADPNAVVAPAPTPGSAPLSADELEEKNATTPQEVKP